MVKKFSPRCKGKFGNLIRPKEMLIQVNDKGQAVPCGRLPFFRKFSPPPPFLDSAGTVGISKIFVSWPQRREFVGLN